MTRLTRTFQLARYLATPPQWGAYVGFVGFRNLGDEVLWHEIRRAFRPLRLVCSPWPVPAVARRIVRLRAHQAAILGGGTLIGEDLEDGSNPFREHFAAVAERARHTAVFGTGVGAICDGQSHQWLRRWRPLLERCAYIGVRGPESVRSLSRIGINAELLGDPACLAARDPGFWNPREKTLGVNVGASLMHDRPGEQDLVTHLTKFIRTRQRDKWKVELFVVVPQDEHVVLRVLDGLGGKPPIVHRFYTNGDQYLDVVRHMSAFVGTKLHSVILAMCAGVPSIMIEYSPKCRDFMQSMGVEEFTIPIADATEDALGERFEALLSQNESLGPRISSRMTQARGRLLERAARVRELLRRK